MDWSNERYVRLYTRDTTSWRRLGWDGQCVLMALLRKVDRSGLLDLDGLEPWEAVMLHIGAPEDVCRRGLDACTRKDGPVEIRGNSLVVTKFMEAQEAIKSDKLRQKEQRDRARAETLQKQTTVTKSDGTVTPRDSTITKSDETSRGVTPSHAESETVTPSHSVLCCAVQSSAVSERSIRHGDSEPVNDQGFDAHRMTLVFRKRYEDVKRSAPNMAGKQLEDFHSRVVRTAELQGRDPAELFAEALEGWLRNPLNEAEKRAPYACFAQAFGDLSDPGGTAPRPGAAPQKVYSKYALEALAEIRGRS